MVRAYFHLAIPMLLLAVLVMEFVGAPVRGVIMPAPRPATKAMSVTAPDLSAEAKILLARPLFSPLRRPAIAAPPPVPQPPRLSGIVITGSARYAIFARSGADPMVAARGQFVGAFKVREITTTQVVISGPTGILTLHTSYPDAGPAVASRSDPGPGHMQSPVILAGGITLYPATAENLPDAADWPGTKE